MVLRGLQLRYIGLHDSYGIGVRVRTPLAITDRFGRRRIRDLHHFGFGELF